MFVLDQFKQDRANSDLFVFKGLTGDKNTKCGQINKQTAKSETAEAKIS